MEEEKKETEEKVVVNENKDKNTIQKLLKIVSVLIAVGSLVLMIFLKVKLKIFIPIMVGIVIIAVILWFGFELYNRIFIKKKKEIEKGELPEPIGEEELKQRVKEIIENDIWQNHVKRWISIKQKNDKKNLRYAITFEPLYTMFEDRSIKRITFIINANYPERMPSVFFDAKEDKINRELNDASIDPEPDPDIKETDIYNQLTGNYVRTREKTSSNKPEIKKEKKGDLE
jgi:hypothetical protein